ncbi:hypothetical protein EC988_000830, partial [Linderina pennispora]
GSVRVLDLDEFLATYHPALLDHYSAVTEATADKPDMDISALDPVEFAQLRLANKSKQGYASYWSPEEVAEGLRMGTLVRGKLRMTRSKDKEPSGVIEREGKPDIVVTGRLALNRAADGDTVVVRVLAMAEEIPRLGADGTSEEDQDQDDADEEMAAELIDAGEEMAPASGTEKPVSGVVVCVPERKWRMYVATLQLDEAGGAQHLAVPVDVHVPKIRIHYMDAAAISDLYFVVAIDGWPADSQYPHGHFVRPLGPIGDLDTEIDVILVERQIAVSQAALGFSKASLREMPVDSPATPWQPDAAEAAGRRDLRDQLIFSIDPKGSQDIDDAISMRRTEQGFEMGVHIADVSQFVVPGSATDIEAQARGTTVYLADRRFNMIPEVLSERICSLRGGADRYAMSVVWQMDSNYNVTDTWFGRTVIRSACEMYYEQAQALLDGAASAPELGNKSLTEKLRSSIVELTTAMRVLRERRRSAGALELASTEVKFSFDPATHAITELTPKAGLEIHRVIEEAMVFANAAVARRIHSVFPKSALLRRHPSPSSERFERLVKAARSRGFDIDCSSNKALAGSLARIVKAAESSDPDMIFMAKSMATLAMQEAVYFATGDQQPAQFAHYGLALEYYTHFTSPIRRYADIIVHRQLVAALSGEDPMAAGSQKWVGDTTERLNELNRQSKFAQRESTELFQSRYVSQIINQQEYLVADGVVAEVRTNGLIVYVPKYGIRGPVHLKDKSGAIKIPLSVLTGKPRDMETAIDGCTDFEAEADKLSVRLPINVPVFHLGSATMTFAVFDHVKVCLRVLETRRRRPPVYLTLVSQAAVQAIGKQPAYRSNTLGIDKKLGNSLVPVWSAKKKEKPVPPPAAAISASVGTPKRKDKKGKTTAEYYSVLAKFSQLSLLETFADVQQIEVDNTSTTSRAGLK